MSHHMVLSKNRNLKYSYSHKCITLDNRYVIIAHYPIIVIYWKTTLVEDSGKSVANKL